MLEIFQNWCPTGSRLDPEWPKAVPKKCKIGARMRPDWIPIGYRLAFLKKKSTPLLCKFEHLFPKIKHFAAHPPPKDPPSPVLSQIRAAQWNAVKIAMIYIISYGVAQLSELTFPPSKQRWLKSWNLLAVQILNFALSFPPLSSLLSAGIFFFLLPPVLPLA